MSLFYADTSALARAYLPDEQDHDLLRDLLLEGEDPVITSELTWLEFARAAGAAERVRRVRAAEVLLDEFDGDCTTEDGPVTLIALRVGPAFDLARDLVRRHPLGTLDALHLAVALTDGADLADGDELVFVTRDAAQAEAARAVGLGVR